MTVQFTRTLAHSHILSALLPFLGVLERHGTLCHILRDHVIQCHMMSCDATLCNTKPHNPPANANDQSNSKRQVDRQPSFAALHHHDRQLLPLGGIRRPQERVQDLEHQHPRNGPRNILFHAVHQMDTQENDPGRHKRSLPRHHRDHPGNLGHRVCAADPRPFHRRRQHRCVVLHDPLWFAADRPAVGHSGSFRQELAVAIHHRHHHQLLPVERPGMVRYERCQRLLPEPGGSFVWALSAHPQAGLR
mmetsp:Transcript_18669/g.51918  ORF Transcript_18669/g.51918 Transcript_18669/m.51918 type:complete len:247 (+) Transcript_18669:953-1693(+)